jgi:hypothetical protein
MSFRNTTIVLSLFVQKHAVKHMLQIFYYLSEYLICTFFYWNFFNNLLKQLIIS